MQTDKKQETGVSGKCATGQAPRRVTLDGRASATAPVQEDGKDGIARIRAVEQATLELYPLAGGGSRGTLLVCPGGGYSILAVEHEGRAIAKMLNAGGFDAAVLVYHVNAGPETRALALDEAKAALALLRGQGAALGLNTRRIGLMGFSAGGHLAARLAHESAALPPDWLVLMYPAYLEKDGVVLEEVAPVNVPTFAFVAADDSHSLSADAFAAACNARGIPCEFHRPASGGHGFGIKAEIPASVRDWPERLCAFLQR